VSEAAVACAAEDAAAAVAGIRRSWLWLSEARLPGTPGTAALVRRRWSAAAERVEADQVRRDKRAAQRALSGGAGADVGLRLGSRGHPSVPAGPHADAGRIGPIGARLQVVTELRAAAEQALTAAGLRVHARVRDPAAGRPGLDCPWCAGTGVLGKPADWSGGWPDPACPLCGGFAQLCRLCRGVGPCGCDLSDAVVHACLHLCRWLAAQLDPVAACALADRLTRISNYASGVLGLGPVDLRWLSAPCPACARRELYAEVSSPDPADWSVSCRSPLCACGGPGCGCGRPVRWPGRRHRWPSAEFAALAERLGVQQAVLLARQPAAPPPTR
jgi:hypothetical protein